MNLTIFRFLLFTFLLIWLNIPSLAQVVKRQVFAIQLGAFNRPDKSRFSSLMDLGEIYTEEVAKKPTRIKLGDYSTREKADSILKIVKARNYTQAYIINFEIVEIAKVATNSKVSKQPEKETARQPKIDRPPVARRTFSVQIGAFEKTTGLNVPNLEKLERTYTEEQDTLTKIMTGVFLEKDSAERYLAKVKSLGFENAFVIESDLRDALMTAPSSPMNSDLAQTYRPVRNFETASFYKRMEGTLNASYPIIVHAYFSSASITGFYDDPKNKSRKKFVYYGYRAGNNSLPETQSSSENGLIVKASASQKNEAMKLSFTVKDMDTNESLNFVLKESYPTGSVQFDIVSIYKKKSQQGNKGEMGADLYLEYPTMVGANSKIVENRINILATQLSGTADESSMSEKIDATLKRGMDKIASYYPQYHWLSQTYETKILENTKNILSLRMSNEQIIVEPQSEVKHKTFNLLNGSEITLGEVLNNGFEKNINSLLREKINKQFAKLRPAASEVNASTEEMIKNYYFTVQGIVFFRDYKKNSLLAEPIEITIPYSEIKLLINKNGFLSTFVK
ncbi:MAG: SPOR domain-containing protein [Cytophagales bacterium]|nr:MAG: SPOR domain-containing protein [Cytophagales bacterium]